MKTFLKRHKKLIGFVGVLSLTIAFAVSASAYSASYTTSRYNSASHESYDNKTYYVKTEYHVGSQAPWDDAYLYAEAGATANHYRQVICMFRNRPVVSKQSYHLWDGIQYINCGDEYSGQDTAPGECSAYIYSGSDALSSLTHYMHLTVS